MDDGGQFLSWVLLVTERTWDYWIPSVHHQPWEDPQPLPGAAGSISMAFSHFICPRPVFFHEKENNVLFASW